MTSPLTGFIRPSSVFINVVLPAPFAPKTDDPTRAQPQVNVADDWGTLVPDREIRSRYNWHNPPFTKGGPEGKGKDALPPDPRVAMSPLFYPSVAANATTCQANRMTVAPCYLDSPKLSIGQRNEPAHHPQGRCIRLPSHTCRHRSFFPKKASTIRVNMATSDDSSAVSLAICDARSFSCLETICQFNLQPASRTTRFQTIFVRDHYPL